MLPPFHAGIDDPRYGTVATKLYHDRTECKEHAASTLFGVRK